MAMRSHKAYRVLSFVIVVALVVVATQAFFTFSYFSVCDVCGRVRHSRDFQPPIIPLSYWSQHSYEETPLSHVADSLIGQHQHNWLFGHGGGNGVTCALGNGQSLWSVSNSKELAVFIEDERRFDGAKKALVSLKLSLHPQSANEMKKWVRLCGYPESGHKAEADYRAWLRHANEERENYFPNRR